MILVRRSAMLTLQLEMMEANWAHNNEGQAGPKSLQAYQRVTNTLRRTLESLGLRRRQRDVTPDLQSYIASRRRRPSRDEVEDIEELEEAD